MELVLDGEPSILTPVQKTGDLERILALPVKDGTEITDLTSRYKTPTGTMTLFPIQSEALYWAEKIKGQLGLVGVGAGKTLISLLLGRAMGAKRVVLMIPPSLKVQLLTRDLPELIKHWQIDLDTLHIVPYSMLSQADYADVLEKLDPDLVVFDEGHMIRRLASARGRRLRRFLGWRKKRSLPTRLVYLSGTMTNDGLFDYGQACAWALGQGSPLPIFYPTLREWAEALDPVRPEETRPPGALRHLCKDGETVREGFQRRLLSTPGVVATSQLSVSCSLKMWRWQPKVSRFLRDAFAQVSKTWSRPDGVMFDDNLSLFRVLRQVIAGFYYYESWPGGVADDEYVESKRDWNRALREVLKRRSRPGFDSPMLVTQACLSGAWTCPEWERWSAVRFRAKSVKAATWVDESVVSGAVEWGENNVGIVWYLHEEVGRLIHDLGGFPWFPAGADKELDEELACHGGSRTIVASVKAHGFGKNLQSFCRNLLVEAISSNGRLEQLIGRTHRTGQRADEVHFYYPDYSWLHERALDRAKRQAKYVEETTKQRQRLGYADWCEEENQGTRNKQEHEAEWFDDFTEGQRDALWDESEED